MKTHRSRCEKVCGSCGRPVGYLDFGGRVWVVEGKLCEMGRAVVLQLHRCPVGGETRVSASASQPGGLPVWCLDRILDLLERALPGGLTTTEVVRRAFHGRVSFDDVWDALVELRRNGEVSWRDGQGEEALVVYWFRKIEREGSCAGFP